MTRRRPSAFDVSFPDEAPLQPAPTTSTRPDGSSNKRQRDDEASGRVSTPDLLTLLYFLVSFYVSRPDEQLETQELVIPGEDPEDEPFEDDEKPVRILTDFSIFDPLHRNEMVSLAAIEEEDGVDRHFEGAGWVTADFISEDVGQEDWDEDEEENLKVYVRLGAILRYTLDYKSENNPFYIETEYGWYILKTPSKEYEAIYRMFYTPRRVAQLVISGALRRPAPYTYNIFIEQYKDMVDIFGRTCQEGDMEDAMEEGPGLKQALSSTPRSRRVPRANMPQPRNRQLPYNRAMPGNQDLAVLKPENQSVTHVTPRIAELIRGLVREEIYVIGARPPPLDSNRNEKQKAYIELCALIQRARIIRKDIDWKKEDRLAPGSDYVYSVTIDGQETGDFILVPIADDNKPPKNLPEDNNVPRTGKIPDYFWFARIVYLMPQEGMAHIQWLEHGSQIFLKELAHPQELFLNDLCGHIPLKTIVGKLVVHERPENVPANQNEYFYKFKHDKDTASLVSIDAQRLQMIGNHLPPENCPVCVMSEERRQAEEPHILRVDGANRGIAYGGRNFHLHDFVLFKAQQGPANIGYIIKVSADNVRVKRAGRIGSLEDILPDDVMRDERHVYLTDEETTVPINDLIQVIFVLPIDAIPHLDEWLEESSDHFFISYTFPTMTTWIVPEFGICETCNGEMVAHRRLLKEYLSHIEERPLAVLDLFGGVGAFSLGMKEGFRGLKVTYAIEISPSAAKTFRRNSPDTIVYNECSNTMLRYAIKKRLGHQQEVPMQMYNGRPGDIDMIIAGFPCQTHSGLNMFKHANDPKSSLIFNALSYVDEYRPKLVYFENVHGFLSYALNATQASIHRLEGGIPMGGLKLVVRALVDLGYQVRFCLLQAAHYGTPQTRVRFVLMAALDGLPLPSLPQPTHHFPETNHLPIDLGGEVIRPIKAKNGAALHPFVTIDDAKQRELIEREQDIRTFVCDSARRTFCGYEGHPGYRHRPMTRYQAVARRRPVTYLQQFTKCLKPIKVERVVSIPLEANADYRSLGLHQQEWQSANPTSWIARNNYRRGLYGRLDGKSYFPTTVTNMDPTAKQCRVLHPHCRRMVSVRELARSQGFPDHFVFEAKDNNVLTMHRQIGNAVPFPVSVALGHQLRESFFNRWLEERDREGH
ncbi:S-adenosyl-L-methionine-dependent methyltransferase [Amanita rubescens]|nr:S-adenosyl-L-methionine-dependent methyltransferase [Amanita rubescens]